MGKRRKCKCGCGRMIRYGQKYVRGHNRRIKRIILEPKKCACGCGEYAKSGNRYILGHNKNQLGKKHSSETRKKMSKAAQGRIVSEGTKEKLRGRVVSDETRAKISKARKGHITSGETREKLSNANKGRTHTVSEKARKKISDANKNSESIWAKYHPHITGYQYARAQDAVRKRDHCRCVLCDSKKSDSKKSKLDVHHVVPVRIGYKSRLCDHSSNLLALCASCHLKIETRNSKHHDKWKEFLPFAKEYLSKFNYETMLLNDYV